MSSMVRNTNFPPKNQETLKVSEIFHSIQGEGICAGTPSVFLRLATCNLHCWFCDTKYTWLFSEEMEKTVRKEMEKLAIKEENQPKDVHVYNPSSEIRLMGIDFARKEIEKYNCGHLVITGGEPLLQQKPLSVLLHKLRKGIGEIFVEVETSGSVRPTGEIIPYVDQWNVSLKLASSGNPKEIREKSQAIRDLKNLRGAFFKFVVQNREDLKEIEEIARRYAVSPEKIILMPEGVSKEEIAERSSWIAKACSESGYRFTTRLQILLWGNVRGK